MATTQGNKLRVGLAQVAPVLGNVARNVAQHEELIAAAQRAQVDFLVFPELSLTGYFLRDMVPDVALPPDAPEINRLVEAAGSMSLAVGFVEQSPHQLFYNSALFAEAGRVAHVHRKVYLPNYGLFDEQHYFAPGDRVRAHVSPQLGRLGVLVCEDFWHLSAAAIMQAEEVDLLVCLSNSPARGVETPTIGTQQTYDNICSAYAQLLSCVVIFVNRVGFEDGLCFWGGSLVAGPDGAILARAPLFEPGLTVAEIDLAELRRQRIATPLARDERLLLTIEELQRIKRRRYES